MFKPIFTKTELIVTLILCIICGYLQIIVLQK